MGRMDKRTDDVTEKALEDTYEIVDSLFESCDEWQCKKCGQKSLGSKYHRCDASITKTICEYCRNYSNGRCRLRR